MHCPPAQKGKEFGCVCSGDLMNCDIVVEGILLKERHLTDVYVFS